MTTEKTRINMVTVATHHHLAATDRKSDLKVVIRVHGQNFEDHLSCEDPCENL